MEDRFFFSLLSSSTVTFFKLEPLFLRQLFSCSRADRSLKIGAHNFFPFFSSTCLKNWIHCRASKKVWINMAHFTCWTIVQVAWMMMASVNFLIASLLSLLGMIFMMSNFYYVSLSSNNVEAKKRHLCIFSSFSLL